MYYHYYYYDYRHGRIIESESHLIIQHGAASHQVTYAMSTHGDGTTTEQPGATAEAAAETQEIRDLREKLNLLQQIQAVQNQINAPTSTDPSLTQPCVLNLQKDLIQCLIQNSVATRKIVKHIKN